LDRRIAIVGVISSKNENIEFALTLFCEKDIMSSTVDIQRSQNSPAATGPDVAQCLDLHFSGIEDLLHRLVKTQTVKQGPEAALWFGSWKMATICAICFICVPGCATPAGILLIKSDNTAVPPILIESAVDPASARADRLPLIAATTPANYFTDADYFDETKIRDEADVFEQPALRGTVEDIVLTASAAEPPATTKPKLRRSARSAFAKMPIETPEPAPRSPSLLEKLFSVFVSQFPQPPSQRQT